MKKSTTYGYIVIPDGDSSLRTDQMQALEKFSPECILVDREYKTKTDRTSLEQILAMLKPEDILVTTKLSNLGRSYTETLEYWNRIVEKFAFVVTLESPVIDTRPGKQKTEKTTAEFLSLLAGTEKERGDKVSKAMAEAKLRGVTPGPKRKHPKNYNEVKARWERHEISGREAGRLLGVDARTFMRWVKLPEERHEA